MKEELCPECDMEIDEDEFEIEKFKCPRCGKIFELAVWKSEANKKDPEEVFNRCMEISGFPEKLKHRFFFNFGVFLQEMVNYLVWGQLSEDDVLSDFQKTIDINKYDAEKFDTYLELFEKFYEWIDEDEEQKPVNNEGEELMRKLGGKVDAEEKRVKRPFEEA